jgi:hypothetical protein
MAVYDTTSPYYTTGFTEFYLDSMVNRPIPKENDDKFFKINQTYPYRPDLLAYDLYGTAGLWWVFYQRNPNTLTKPPIDFVAGTLIYLPKMSTLRTVLGL